MNTQQDNADSPITLGVLALQGAVQEHCDAVVDCGEAVKKIRCTADLDGIDGIIVPGGESTTLSKMLMLSDLGEVLGARIAAGLPALGTCAGMILLARQVVDTRSDMRSFGVLDATVRRNAFGRQVDSFETDCSIPVLGAQPFRTVFIRAPWVEKVGSKVTVLCSVLGRDGGAHPVAVRQGSIVATSFHPELVDDRRFHHYFLEIVGKCTRREHAYEDNY